LKSLLLKNNSKYIPNTDTTINIDSSQQQIQIRLTAHLGLIVPKLSSESQEPKCYAQVADTICTWEEGKALVFDDSYEHEVVLKSSSSSQEDEQPEQMRSVLLIQFWHPCLISKQKALEEALYTKTYDQIRHYCPPIPTTINTCTLLSSSSSKDNNNNDSYYWRCCTESTICSRCWRTGYDSIRVINNYQTHGIDDGDIHFICVCGEWIQ
jgi:hypothetical protein